MPPRQVSSDGSAIERSRVRTPLDPMRLVYVEAILSASTHGNRYPCLNGNHYWHSDLTQYWWIGVRQSKSHSTYWIDYNTHIKKKLTKVGKNKIVNLTIKNCFFGLVISCHFLNNPFFEEIRSKVFNFDIFVHDWLLPESVQQLEAIRRNAQGTHPYMLHWQRKKSVLSQSNRKLEKLDRINDVVFMTFLTNPYNCHRLITCKSPTNWSSYYAIRI